MFFRRRPPAPSWSEAEATLVAEAARQLAVRASGQRGLRVMRVELDGDTATAELLMLDGEFSTAHLSRHMGQWTLTAFGERRDGR